MSTIALQPPILIVPLLSVNQWIEVNDNSKHMPHTSNSGITKRERNDKFMDKEICAFKHLLPII